MTPLRTLLVASITSTLVAAAAAAAVPAAHAQTWRHTDATGDVQVTRDDGDGEPTAPVVDRSERRGDLTNLRVTYGARSLRVAASVRSREIAYQDVSLAVVSSRGHRYRIVVGYQEERVLRVFRDGYRYRCDGLATTRTSAGYVVTVPRACFDGAYRVRVGLQTSSGTDFGDRDVQTYDDVLRTGRYTDGGPRLGPWVAAG